MSRLSFRHPVAAARPASAWVLATVAGASLWITHQLEPWALVAQAGAVIFSLWRRERPFAWQSSPIALNVGMFAVAIGTISVALRGAPSTVALAHFAATTQGLQLLDARPRKTEFLLVALALFQVILASNLTDSVFFPPLLIAFVLAAVWTLLMHTLWSEALDAGDSAATLDAVTPGLVRTTVFASTLSVLLALLLFVTLPRVRTSAVRATGLGTAFASAGFSDRVELGDLGRIRKDPRVVMRIETLTGAPPAPGQGYWRGLAFDHFDGRSWSITPLHRQSFAGIAEAGVPLSLRPDAANLVQRIVREPVEAGVLFRAGDPRQLRGAVRHLQRDTAGSLYAAGQARERVRYTIATEHRSWGDPALQGDAVAVDPRHPERSLQLPPLDERVAELARQIVRDAESDADRVRAVERWLMHNGRYTDVPPEIDPEDPTSPVVSFLFGARSGHCEYFATAMAVLLRSVGIPARVVNGFAGGRENPIGGFLEISHADAHSWVEVRYARAGWVRYDPTPPDLRAVPVAAADFGERARQLASAIELWWFQRVVGFDRADQIHAIQRAWTAWRSVTDDAGEAVPGGEETGPVPAALRDFAPLGAAALLGCALVLLRRRRAGATQPRDYARALRLLARKGLPRTPCTTARSFAEQVRATHPAAADPFDALTEAHLAECFGSRPAAPTAGHLDELRRALP